MPKNTYFKRKDCRFCHKKKLKLIIDLGKQPSQGAYLIHDQLGKEKIYPLRVYQCQNCKLVQLSDVVYDEFFQPYISSVTLTEHFEKLAEELSVRFLHAGDFVVEFGSNDGVLLDPLQKRSIKVLGVEPDERIAQLAIDKKIPTIIAPFSDKVAKKINRKAKMVLANNVFAHIDDMDEVMKGVDILLEDNGFFIFEVHNLMNILVGKQYDNIYFEHLNYYTVSTLASFLTKHGFEIFEVKPIPTHGGSMRVYSQKISKNILAEFKQSVEDNKNDLLNLLQSIKKEGKRIIGYGAAGRANTLLNYCGIDINYLDYIVDESPSRYGRFTPGSHISVVKPSKRDLKVNYILILAWNYQEQIR